MVKKPNSDDALRTLLNDNENFASLFNAKLFNGQRRIDPADLYEVDSVKSIELAGGFTLQKEADVAKLWDDGKTRQILVAECQTYMDQGMAVRQVEENAARVGAQRKGLRIRHENEKVKWADSDAFLSGMLPEDRIIRIRVLTIYFAGKPWTAPLNIDDLYEPYADMGPEYNEDGVTVLEMRDPNLRGLSPAMQNLHDLLQIQYRSSRKDFWPNLEAFVKTHNVTEPVMAAFARTIGKDAALTSYYKALKATGKGGIMSTVIAQWEREWVEELHPEWIEAVTEEQEKNKKLIEEVKSKDRAIESRDRAIEDNNRTIESKDRTIEDNNRTIARFAALVVPSIVARHRAAHLPMEATVQEIMEQMSVSEEVARRFAEEYSGEDQ